MTATETETKTELVPGPTVTSTETIEETVPAKHTTKPSQPTEHSVRPSKPAEPSDNGYAYYEDCDAARAAGAAPLHRGDPGYRPELDRDGDGVACEPYHG